MTLLVAKSEQNIKIHQVDMALETRTKNISAHLKPTTLEQYSNPPTPKKRLAVN